VDEHDQDGAAVAVWVPFVGDIRWSPKRLMHVACYIDERGLDAFVSLVADHSMRQQAEIFRLLDLP
jgi:hypothetical protein